MENSAVLEPAVAPRRVRAALRDLLGAAESANANIEDVIRAAQEREPLPAVP